MNIYDFDVKDAKGNIVNLGKYKGKVLLIVNTATACGFTPQYEELQKIYEMFKDKGLEILDFPCNQFGNQAPGSIDEISEFCTVKFGTKFPLFGKVDVNGDAAEPLFKYLVEQKGFGGFDDDNDKSSILDNILSENNPNYKNEPSIKWNFTKFLINKDGQVVNRFEPTKKMEDIQKQIQEII